MAATSAEVLRSVPKSKVGERNNKWVSFRSWAFGVLRAFPNVLPSRPGQLFFGCLVHDEKLTPLSMIRDGLDQTTTKSNAQHRALFLGHGVSSIFFLSVPLPLTPALEDPVKYSLRGVHLQGLWGWNLGAACHRTRGYRRSVFLGLRTNSASNNKLDACIPLRTTPQASTPQSTSLQARVQALGLHASTFEECPRTTGGSCHAIAALSLSQGSRNASCYLHGRVAGDLVPRSMSQPQCRQTAGCAQSSGQDEIKKQGESVQLSNPSWLGL